MSSESLSKRRILILYGTQTGCAHEVAERIGREVKTRCLFRSRVIGFDEYDATNLVKEPLVIFVVSTTGQGDTPDNMKSFWRFLLRKGLPLNVLSHISFAVFGLGDSSYVKFNFVGKRLFRRLVQLGGQPLLRRGDGDDQNPFGLDGELDPWLLELWRVLVERYPLPMDAQLPDPNSLSPPRFLISLQKSSHFRELQLPASSTPEDSLISPSPFSSSPSSWNLNNPYFAKLIKNQRITSSECEQDVRHIELDLGKSEITYLPGDVVYIHPRNPRDIAEDFIRFLGYDPDDFIVELKEQAEEEDEEEEKDEGKGGKGRISTSSRFSSLRLPLSLRDLATYYLDFLGSPKRYFFELMSKFATAEHEVEKLNFFASSEGQEELRFYCTKEHRSFLEVFQDFPSTRPPLNYLLEMIPPLLPRPFSISSSLKLHPNQLHVTMLVVKYLTPLKRRRKGLCSNWLASLDPSSHSSSEKDGSVEEIPRVPIWVKSGSLRLPPNPETPVIMVGPGTGLAIFRSFIQERHWQKQQGSHPGAMMAFFFGCRKREHDYHYGEEFEARKEDGTLSLFEVAFSRDQAEKVYVQHKIKERGREIWEMIQMGGYFYISGSASQMPTDVRKTVLEILQTEGGLTSSEEAENLLKRLELTGRFATETWQ